MYHSSHRLLASVEKISSTGYRVKQGGFTNVGAAWLLYKETDKYNIHARAKNRPVTIILSLSAMYTYFHLLVEEETHFGQTMKQGYGGQVGRGC